ncbi:MAG: histidinol dehydrogenase [Chloroflexota bacterium]|nr:histidinol dehydrogenase [Chloroflexota bacterium]
MIKIEGFDKAKQLLSRENYWVSFVPSPELRAGIKQLFGKELSPQEVIEQVIADVRKGGDEALLNYTKKLDGVELRSLEVTREEIKAAYDMIDKELIPALEFAAKRIHAFHSASKSKVGKIAIDKQLGQQICPLDKVGIYVPGGTATYPSTVLMTAIPAKVAGVREIIMVSPPGKDGKIPAPTLVAADIAEVNRIFKIGGAQAIAALAYGTKSIPKVDKICGPGNIFVTLAKKLVYGAVAIDSLEGPSELVIIADKTANPIFCAADLLAQAEHDAMASIILITTSPELAEKVNKEIALQLENLKRRSIANQAIEKGMIVLVDHVGEAIELANIYAPEHLSLMVSNSSSLVNRIHNAGCIFVGESSPVVLGDYIAGPSHVLPTGGSARFSSPLGITDFLKVSNIIALDETTMQQLSHSAIVIAKTEGLDAHSRAMEIRLTSEH